MDCTAVGGRRRSGDRSRRLLPGRRRLRQADGSALGRRASRAAHRRPTSPSIPTQIYEILWLLPVAALLWKRRHRSPFLFGEYIALNGLGRIVDRDAAREPEGGVRPHRAADRRDRADPDRRLVLALLPGADATRGRSVASRVRPRAEAREQRVRVGDDLRARVALREPHDARDGVAREPQRAGSPRVPRGGPARRAPPGSPVVAPQSRRPCRAHRRAAARARAARCRRCERPARAPRSAARSSRCRDTSCPASASAAAVLP